MSGSHFRLVFSQIGHAIFYMNVEHTLQSNYQMYMFEMSKYIVRFLVKKLKKRQLDAYNFSIYYVLCVYN